MRELTLAEALNEALREEMRRDERVIVMGEDVGVAGGVYKVTKGLLEEFGPDRVRDTPISEAAIVGAAVGAAVAGLRPVAEIMYMDFLTIALDQLVTHAAKLRFMSGGQLTVPLVVRCQYSLGRVHGSQHSQFFPSWFLQSPGLKVVLPSTPYDAKGLLKTSIRDDNPVLFIEPGALYHRIRGEVPEEDYTIPLGVADVKKRGDEVTVVSVSRVVHEALKAAEILEQQHGISVEVIDLRSIQPMDYETVVKSLMKTNRLVIAEDSVKTGGVSAEVAAYVAENAVEYLDAPIVRVNSPPLPTPFSPELERLYMVDAGKIVDAVVGLVK
ncbi:MAG TPA: alpha-ketoacid dehydrogenase subunit beta [Candidatus Caldiarchaeum subterraneum]|uniref:Alpha-ketoacid dehydrogenase subunit beta n=1 Tax=Caldiarchaeum subterraneum TaxID=311458 RepID=A0A832ZV50_CALS0|nr:alpha-ketoacid dehydrogenase subunit beta [Aigarchaeota archaeon]HIQ29498.1 alpha-ketoacid dehydrogenase subunit beta [Candidatus Caldarchaeum subterraneum]